MASVETSVYLRLLVPALVGWVAWAVYRAPCQERSNRVLAAFLVLIAVEFLLEFVWLVLDGSAVALPVRWAQFLLGLADPPLLLAYALTFPRPPRWWRTKGFVACAAVAVAMLAAALAAGHSSHLDFTSPWAAAADFAYFSAAYLAAFLVLARRFLAETRRFLARQLLYVALGTGFVALSRTAALFLDGGAGVGPPWGLWAVGAGALAVLAAFAGVGLLSLAWRSGAVRSPAPLLGALGLALAAFLGTWAALSALGGVAATFLFGLRWVFFALIVGYGILRFQIFDFQAETWGAVAYLVATLAGVLVALQADAALADAGLAPPTVRVAAVAAGAAAMGAALAALRRLGRSARRGRAPQASRQALLEIYEATLEYAIDPRSWSAAERRLIETLRELFQVSPREHELIVARLAVPPA